MVTIPVHAVGRIGSALLVIIASLAGSDSALAASNETAQPSRPNIILVMVDDLGYGDLGCYGQSVIRTKNLDRMAAEGVRFTQVYAGSTVCAPSRCALMTGKHTGHARVRGNARVPLEPEDVTVAEVLQGAGYRTALIGKWGLGEADSTGIPTRQGFDSFFGYLNQRHAHNYYPEFLWNNEKQFPIVGNVAESGVASEKAQYSHDLLTSRALHFLDEPHDEPFFLYLAYTIPHANNEAGRALGDGMEVPSYAPYHNRDWPNPQKGHAAMISRLDRDMGLVFKRLADLDLDESTLVLFTSDNGPHKEGGADPEFFQSSGPLQGYKRSLHDGGIRVPTIARWPGMIEPGRVSDAVWAFWDVLPTLAELADVEDEVPNDIDGRSVVPALVGPKVAGRSFEASPVLYWEFHERGFHQAVRMGDWKAIRHGLEGPIELYDLSVDLDESEDVSGSNPEIVAQAVEALSSRTDDDAWPIQPTPRRNRNRR